MSIIERERETTQHLSREQTDGVPGSVTQECFNLKLVHSLGVWSQLRQHKHKIPKKKAATKPYAQQAHTAPCSGTLTQALKLTLP